MKCASLLKSQIEEESIFNTDLCIYEINETQVATPSSVDLAANMCRLFSNMAYDDSFRDFVAEHGLPIVMQCMKFCDSHTFVLRYGCFAIFNFIYRNEKHYKQALQKNVPEFLTSILNEFGHKDKELYAAVERSKSLLLPNGWRLID